MAALNAADVVVVGAGGSGLFAAIEAAEMGRRVLVLEKNPAPGGMTNWAI
ncbi:MAG: FAD-dependent oxidoreductase, partial [Mesorhizobium sp.]